MIFVDTNYFLRFLLNDISDQHQQSVKLFNEASKGKIKLFTDTIVIFEIYWILKKIYGAQSQQTISSLLQICRFDFINLLDRAILIKAITNFSFFNFDLEDSYHFCFAKLQKAENIATFDQKLAKKYQSLKKLK